MEDSIEGSFEYWVNRHKRAARSLWGSVIVSLLLAIGSRFGIIKGFLKNPWFPGSWFCIHLLVIVILFILTYKLSPRKSKEKYPEPSKAVRDFHYLLLALWIAWAILYSALAYRAFDTIDGRNKLLSEAHNVKGGETKNNAIEVLNFLREAKNRIDFNDALTLAEKYPTDYSGESKPLETAVRDFRDAKNNLKSGSWEIFLNCLNNVQATIVLLLFWVLAFPRDSEKIFLIALVVIVGTFLSLVVGRYPFDGAPGVLGGLFGGVALALWVGRLDSKFLMAPPGYILVLYFYAILQATWFVFRDEDEKVLVITGLALILKFVVYIVCSWLLASGRLLYFFQELRLLYGLAEENEDTPMYGLVTVEDRLKAFLDDIRKSEASPSNDR